MGPGHAEPEQRQELGELDQRLRFDLLVLGQALARVLLVQKGVEAPIEGLRESEGCQVLRDLEEDLNRRRRRVHRITFSLIVPAERRPSNRKNRSLWIPTRGRTAGGPRPWESLGWALQRQGGFEAEETEAFQRADELRQAEATERARLVERMALRRGRRKRR
jgi:hypothetical protein